MTSCPICGKRLHSGFMDGHHCSNRGLKRRERELREPDDGDDILPLPSRDFTLDEVINSLEGT